MAVVCGWAVPAGAREAAGTMVDTLAALFARLGGCWTPPTPPPGKAGMEITVLLAFRRDGSLLAKPAIVYETRAVSDEERSIYTLAVAAALQRCTPMPFSEGLGNAVAGRPLRIRFDARRTRST